MPDITISQIYGFAKDNRKNQTYSEKLLWTAIRNRRLSGLKFRREHVIETFIVDFYCAEHRLVIEVDGDIHDRPDVAERDDYRQRQLEEMGYRVVRFDSNQVINQIEVVMKRIAEVCGAEYRLA